MHPAWRMAADKHVNVVGIADPITEQLRSVVESYKTSTPGKAPIHHDEDTRNQTVPRYVCIKKMKFNLPQSFSEVYPNVYLGDGILALSRQELVSLGFTHVLNCAQGKKESQVATDHAFYQRWPVTYTGIPAHDSTRYDMLQHLTMTTDFIKSCISVPGNKIYVHCHSGVSRAATVVIGFLMLQCRMPLLEALHHVLRRRSSVSPNHGFLRQLATLDRHLRDTNFYAQDLGAVPQVVTEDIKVTTAVDSNKG